eukprot:CAMPEP_0181445800 /NCGR_PEP_ID=MMETSP1110-20121109/25775_1 /TAXON_ID=174948 /ORGANISM="Symbiodinium sp., Strain CCMP421" /LENGTH=66 /DNA_ID=CAMNT_0023569857 /DNA_START=56 /DNA_END=253 /DNA_ORIENTATION=+
MALSAFLAVLPVALAGEGGNDFVSKYAGNYQQYMNKYAADYSKYMGGSQGGSQAGDYQKYMQQYAG